MKLRSASSVLWVAALCALVLASGSLTVGRQTGPAAYIPFYLLVTIVVAWQVGLVASIAVNLCATLGLDFFFTEPRFTLRVASAQDIIALISFAAVSLLVSHLSSLIRANAERLRTAEEEQRSLYALSRSALLLDWKVSVATQICFLVLDQLKLTGVALLAQDEHNLAFAGDGADAAETLHAALRAVTTQDEPGRSERIRLLRFGVRTIGVVLFRGSIEPLMADAVATLIATHLERTRALSAEVSAESQAVSERLRTAVLDGLAHAVKTPLTTIMVSSSGIREVGSLSPLQTELAEVIEGQASYLATLTDKLLRTAKLESGDLLFHPRDVDLRVLLEHALAGLRSEHDVDRVRVHLEDDATMFNADPQLLEMALVQLLENALKYSPDGTRVLLQSSRSPDGPEIFVHNEGSVISEREQSLIFERYYRSPSTEHQASGTGVGLSVAKRAVEAHGGQLHVESSVERGTTFTVRLPA